ERSADGLADAGELRQAENRVGRAVAHTEDYEWSPDKQALLHAANAVGHATRQPEAGYPLSYLAASVALRAMNASVTEGLPERDGRAGQRALLRDILGPLPFRPVNTSPSLRTGTVVSVAQGIYEARAFDRLPVLGDALEEAGCSEVELLRHL